MESQKPMHKTNSHPFHKGDWHAGKPKTASMAGVRAVQKAGNKISANASMKKKRPMEGPGTAD